MAGFDPYHVPQQSRRDKLRALLHNDHQGLVPFYDPSDLLTYTNLHHHHNTSKQSSDAREEGVNLIMSTATTAASTSHYAGGMSPISSTFQEFGNNPFLYTPQNPRFLDQSFHGGHEAMVYKPEGHNNNNNNTLNNSNSQGLSLSLSSHYHSNQSISLPLELNLQQYSFGSTCNNDMSKSCVPLGPFKGYASILKGSRFLTPAQQLLEELCDVGREFFAEKLEADSGLMDPPPDGNVVIDESQEALSDGSEHGRKKSRLISMLDELYRKYKQYYHQLQTVVVSFETVAGLGNAAPFANLALKSMFKHFRCLKDAITDQLQCASKTNVQVNCERDSIPRVGNPGKGPYCERQAMHNVDHHQPVWRPQRGLPERAVSVLRAWLFDHFLHPYPTDTDKVMLAKQTGLSRNQVSNWFINARVRLWKPMVEEIHMLDTRQAHKVSQREGQNMSNPNIEHFPISNSLVCEADPSTSAPRRQEQPSKRTRNDHLTDHIPIGNEDMMTLSYDNLSSHSRVGTGGVSLTLGLHHQNNGIGLSEPFRINAARRFGIDANNEGFIVGGLETQNGQYGRGDIMGEQFLHEFVG